MTKPDFPYSFGDRRLIGQQPAREQLQRILQSGRIGHAYLFSGPDGVGKTAFALALAEILNGVDHLTDLQGEHSSKKSSWFTHPDIHLFIPLPAAVAKNASQKSEELKSRLTLLKKDPYEIIDFKMRPVLDDHSSSTSRQAFYPIKYFREDIYPKAFLKPNEGRYTILIVTGIESMRVEAANTFLKLLEEPPENVIFLLTANSTDQLLPTILSRCQHIRLNPLSQEEVADGLINYDGFNPEDAGFLARISGGNYSLTRFYDLENLQATREEVISFLRLAYSQDVPALLKIVQDWQSKLNSENQIGLCNTLEMFLRDLLIYRESGDARLISNIDQKKVIVSFCESLAEARLTEMISHLQKLKGLLYQNIQFKLIFTVLAIRFSFLMRGKDPIISDDENWKHLPALELD
ncbi:MAG: hypothetical protein WD599_04370 [Balneolaceae bacterium]